MAFGFAQPTSGLITGVPVRPDRRLRYALDFACTYADAVGVLAGPDASADGVAWVRARYPAVTLIGAGDVHGPLTVDTPAASRSSPVALTRPASVAPSDLLFAVDPCGPFIRLLAAGSGAQPVPCFAAAALRYARAAAPTVAPRTGADRPLVRVCVFGPESTGKSTLAGQLAEHYETAYVPEYVRSYLDATGSPGLAPDVPWIARGQRAAEAAAAAQAERVLICDTNLATVALWSEVLFGAAPAWLTDEAARQRYDLWLLTDIDVPFAEDPQRCFPEPAQRACFMGRCRETLARLAVSPVLLQGAPAARLQVACAAIDALLA